MDGLTDGHTDKTEVIPMCQAAYVGGTKVTSDTEKVLLITYTEITAIRING